MEAARDFSPRRAELWRDVYVEHMTIHDRGETWADVSEGNPWGRGSCGSGSATTGRSREA
jgi:hypothetical protein